LKRLSVWAPWLAALAGIAFTLLAFWPGYLSWDSAYQWWQARGAPLDPVHPPVMVRIWMLSRALLPDPGGMLLLQCLVWWSALGLFAQALGGPAFKRVAIVLVLGLWPPLLGLLPHLWKDVWMSCGFALAVALLAMDLRSPHRGWRLSALLALTLACAFRLNALSAALPLLVWIAWREASLGTGMRLLCLLVSLVAVQTGSALINHVPEERQSPGWTMVALWDVAAVSIAENRLLFPPGWTSPDLSVADLRRDFVPYVNVPSFESGQLRLNPDFVHTKQEYDQLLRAWAALPFSHTRAWWWHRVELSSYLFGLRPAQLPDYLVLQPGVVAYADNPKVQRNDGPLHRWLQPRLYRLIDTPVFAPWLYLLLSLLLLAWQMLRRAFSGAQGLAVAVTASSLCLALPLTVLAPSSDFRYLGWSVLATLMALMLTLLYPRRGMTSSR